MGRSDNSLPSKCNRDEGQLYRRAADDRRGEQQRAEPFKSPAEVEAFFRECDALDGPEREPDWHEHLETIAASRRCCRGPTDRIVD